MRKVNPLLVTPARLAGPTVNRKIACLGLRLAGSMLLVVVLSPGKLFAQHVSSTNAPPVTIRLVQTNEFEPFPKMGTVFSATNHSDQTVSLTAPAIEVKSGSKWSEQGGPNLKCIVFTGPGYPMHIGPHQAAFFVLEFSPRVPSSSPGVNYLPQEPAGTLWRLRLNVQENLTGLADASARAKRVSATIKDQLGGNTNSSMTEALSPKTTFFGKPVVVVSEEISK